MKLVKMPDGRIVDHATHQIELIKLSDGRIITNVELQQHPEDWHKIVLSVRPSTPFPPKHSTYWTDVQWTEWRQKLKWLRWSMQLSPIN